MGRKDLPAVDESLPRAIKHPLKRTIEEIQALTGMRGDPLDRALTWRDLVDQGLAKLTGRPGSSGTPPGSIVIPTPEVDEPDLTPPPNVTGLVAVAAFAHVIVEWDAAVYTLGRGHGQTNIYVAKRLTTDPPATFADAVRVWEATGALTIAAIPAELGVRWHIWAKWQTADGVESIDPAGGVNGVEVTVGKIGNADLGPLIVEAANLAEEAVDLGSTTVTGTITDPVRFGALAVGYTVTQYLLATSGVMGNLVVDNAQIANVSAAKLTVGDGTVGGNLRSTNYVSGVSGWLLRPDGYAEMRDAVVRGTVHSTNGTFDGQVTIRDPGGAIIFQSGGNLDYTRVGGTKPPSNADHTASNTAAAIAGQGAFATLSQITGGNVSTYIAAGAIGNAYIGNIIESAGYSPGVAGWRINKDGTAEFHNVKVRGDVQATSLNFATGTFSGTFSGPSGTFGTITAGLMLASGGTSYVNLNATGTQNFIYAGGGAVRITADGDAYFTKILASGSNGGGTQLVVPTGGGEDPVVYTYPDVVFYVDTGYNIPYHQFTTRTLTARVAATGSVSWTPTVSADAYGGSVQLSAEPVILTPYFGAPISSPVNPYGAGNARVYLRVTARFWTGQPMTSVTCPAFDWTLDTVG